MIRSSRQTFEFTAFVDIYNQLQPQLSRPQIIELDLSGHHFFGPGGMAPLVAVIDHYTQLGWTFEVGTPSSPKLETYWDAAGWLGGIIGKDPPPIRSGSTFTPLLSYGTHEELNSRLKIIMEVLARVSDFCPGVLASLEWAMNEIADNVVVHAGGALGWIQAISRPNSKRVELVVADCGLGIHRTIRDSHPEILRDEDALRLAIERGVTRDKAIGQGNGLAGSIGIATAGHGWVNILSGTATLRLFEDGRLDDLPIAEFPGTVVTLTLPTDQEIDAAGALWGHMPTSSFELSHVNDEGVLFTLREESTGFGNRGSGTELATKLRNIAMAFPDEQVIIDFEGIDVASASFLDEFLAKMIKEEGASTFFQRFGLRNMNDFVRRTADAVIAQRLAG
jgi:hypothetical protein